MTERLEQRYCIKFCQKLGDSHVETIRKIHTVFGDDAMGIEPSGSLGKGLAVEPRTGTNSHYNFFMSFERSNSGEWDLVGNN